MPEMDESAILAGRVEADTIETKTEGGIETTYREHASLFDQFGVEKTEKADKALADIWSYCKKMAGTSDKDAVLLQVIKLKNELGSVALGEAPYSKMFNYIQVYKQFENSGKLLEELKGKGKA